MLWYVALFKAVVINNIPENEANLVSDINLEDVQKQPTLQYEDPEYFETAKKINTKQNSNKYLKRNPETYYTSKNNEPDELYNLKEHIYNSILNNDFRQKENRRFNSHNRRIVQYYR